VTKPALEIVIASTRPGRVDLPLFDEPHHPMLHTYVHQHTKDWSATVERAVAFVFVMPEYNYGFNAALKNAIDYLPVEWQYKPVGFVSYGGLAGGTRAVQMIKQVISPPQDGAHVRSGQHTFHCQTAGRAPASSADRRHGGGCGSDVHRACALDRGLAASATAG
jgi:NAD(P)H-dependent FMN reductase